MPRISKDALRQIQREKTNRDIAEAAQGLNQFNKDVIDNFLICNDRAEAARLAGSTAKNPARITTNILTSEAGARVLRRDNTITS